MKICCYSKQKWSDTAEIPVPLTKQDVKMKEKMEITALKSDSENSNSEIALLSLLLANITHRQNKRIKTKVAYFTEQTFP